MALDQDKKLIVTIKKADLAKDSADARPEVFSKENALDAKITELDNKDEKRLEELLKEDDYKNIFYNSNYNPI